MKGLRDERRKEEQGGIVKLAFNEGPTHQKENQAQCPQTERR
jgi:hypothetical protein